MKGIFNYDSKFTQALMWFADVVILNGLYLLFCLPVFTIGAAQAGLYNGFRVMIDPEDDSSCAAAFIRGFKNGFTVVTPVWLILSLVVAVTAYSCVALYALEAAGEFSPTFLGVAALVVAIIFQTVVPIFHSRFGCTRRQLLKNAWFLLLAHPLRCILCVAMMWGPVLMVLLLDFFVFMQLFIVIIILWYGLAGLMTATLMRKPFKALEQHFYETHDEKGNPIEQNDEPSEKAPALPQGEEE